MAAIGIIYELVYLTFFSKKIMGLQSITKDEWKITQV